MIVKLLFALVVGSLVACTQAAVASANTVEAGDAADDNSYPPQLIINAQDETSIPVDSDPVVRFVRTAIVRAVTVNPDGTLIASGDDEDEVQIWDLATGELIGTSGGNAQQVQSVIFSPDGQSVISGSVVPGRIQQWRWQEPETAASQQDAANTYSVAMSPNGSLLATGHSDGVINLWNPIGEQVRTIAAFSSPSNAYFTSSNVVAVAFSPDGETLASRAFNSSSGAVKLWDVSTGELLQSLPAGSSGGVNSIAFSPDGTTVAGYAGGIFQAGVVSIWEADSGEPVAALESEILRPHAVAFSPDGQLLAVGGLSDLIEVWDVATQTVVHRFETGFDLHHVYSIAFAPDNRTFVTSGAASLPTEGQQGTIMVWSLPCEDAQLEANTQLTQWSANQDVDIHRVLISPNGDQFDVDIFYNTDEALQQFNQDGTSDALKASAVRAIQAMRCSETPNSAWNIRFNSYDFILENYQGSYQFYYQR